MSNEIPEIRQGLPHWDKPAKPPESHPLNLPTGDELVRMPEVAVPAEAACCEGAPPKIVAEDPEGRQVGGNHYQQFAIQPIEFIVKNKLEWCEANAVKYTCRHRHKGGAEDVRKAIHYLELLLHYEYGSRTMNKCEPPEEGG
jgi:hypothetical protein